MTDVIGLSEIWRACEKVTLSKHEVGYLHSTCKQWIINSSNGLVKILGGYLFLNFPITKEILWISENISIYIQLTNNVAQMDF